MPNIAAPLALALMVSFAPSCASIGDESGLDRNPLARDIGCVESAIRFDASSIETITLRPEEILENADAFWEGDRAYWLVSRWLEDVGAKRPIEAWLPLIERKAQVPVAQRGADRFLAVTRQLMAGEQAFLEKSIPHICSFVPDGRADMSTNIYFTTHIPQNAFQKHYNVVLNISHPDWKDPPTIMNTLIHELFHVAFYRYEPLMMETQTDNSEKYDILLNLMNEGMATYVAYAALPLYPSTIRDYALFDDPNETRRSIGKMNSLLSSIDSIPPDIFRERMFSIGVLQRALYIAGGHAARTIERSGGREMLREAMRRGPRAFVSMYNIVAQEDERLVEFPLPPSPSPFQRMRQAALAGDIEAMHRAMADIREHCAQGGEPVGHSLHTTGQLLLRRHEWNAAIEVFDLYRELVPAASNPYEGLATAYFMRGDRERRRHHVPGASQDQPGKCRGARHARKARRSGIPAQIAGELSLSARRYLM